MKFRYEITPHDPDRYVCHVGWGKTDDSYFIYVARRFKTVKGRIVKDTDGFTYDGHTILWIGTTHNEIESVEEVARLLLPYATLPATLYQPLRDTRLQNADDRRATTRSNIDRHTA